MTLQARTKALSAALERAKAQRAAQTAAEEAPCNRRDRRKQTALPAMLTFPNMRVTVPCTVADMSGTGAKLAFPATTAQQFGELDHLPDRMTLVLKADRMQVDCEVKWRRAGKIGVRFLGPPKPVPAGRR